MKYNLILMLLLFLSACNKPGSKVLEVPNTSVVSDGTVVNNALDYYSCGVPQSILLLTSSGTVVGQMTVSNSWDKVQIKLVTTGNWIFDKTRLFVGNSQDIPKNSNGTIKYNQLPYLVTHPWDTQTYILTVDRGSLNSNITVVFSYDVLRVNKNTCGVLESKNICSSYVYILQNCIEV